MSEASEMAARLNALVDQNGKRERVAKATGIPLPTLDRYCRGDTVPPADRLGVIAKLCEVTTDFIIFGGQTLSKITTTQAAPSETEDVASIPLLDVIVSAGPGFENAKPYEIDRLPFPRAWLRKIGLPVKYARFLDCRGDSMEPTIADGAIVLADIRFQHATREGIYVLIDGNNVRIKRIAPGWQGSIVLISDNERYASETLAAPDAEALRVAGKVVWAGGEL